MLNPIRIIQQQFSQRIHFTAFGVQQNRADFFADGRAPRFPGDRAEMAIAFKKTNHLFYLGGFTGALYAFKRNKHLFLSHLELNLLTGCDRQKKTI